jgi:hypothetical protein
VAGWNPRTSGNHGEWLVGFSQVLQIPSNHPGWVIDFSQDEWQGDSGKSARRGKGTLHWVSDVQIFEQKECFLSKGANAISH